jgi:murein DD-endopeptidase MepM/ murein hydrolase activator NlpD
LAAFIMKVKAFSIGATLALLVGAGDALAQPRLTVSSTTPKAGDPVLVTVAGVAARPQGTGGRVQLAFFPVRGGWQAVFAVPHDDPPGELRVEILGLGLKETLSIRANQFPQEAINIAPELAEPSPEMAKRIDADNSAIVNAARNSGPPLFQVPFRYPTGKITSPFGAERMFNGDIFKSQHLGMDVAASLGAPVRAVARGKVALVYDGFLVGGTVVVVHGAGIASVHFHVSDIGVAAGDEVERGAVLGKVSLTGRTTGPHIHVGIWVAGGFVDPAVFARLKLGSPVIRPDSLRARK